jgi:hypothetical protein
MFRSRKNKEENRYYLLPGMGRSNRQQHQRFIKWAFVVGIIFAALVGSFVYFISSRF